MYTSCYSMFPLGLCRHMKYEKNTKSPYSMPAYAIHSVCVDCSQFLYPHPHVGPVATCQYFDAFAITSIQPWLQGEPYPPFENNQIELCRCKSKIKMYFIGKQTTFYYIFHTSTLTEHTHHPHSGMFDHHYTHVSSMVLSILFQQLEMQTKSL